MTISAPGKLLLFGEHAVVYGYPCIVTAVSERLFVTSGASSGDTRFIDRAIAAWGSPEIKLSATSSFSGKYGLGSSSAVTVAALKYLKPDASHKDIFDAAYKIVLDVQGTGSGFDVAAAVFGGTLYYIKNKVIEPLAVKDISLVVGYTGIKSNTVDLVKMIAEKRKIYPEKVERIFQAIAKIVEEAKKKMVEGDWERVGKLMDFNQEYLRDLGVSSEKLESLIHAAKKAGAWGAKLSGAGGGDCMIALAAPDKRQAVEEAITKAGGEVVHVSPSAPGVRMDLPAGEAGTTDNQQELLIVVDRDDNILGYKTRYECHHNKSLIHRAVGLFIFDSAGRVLLQRRSLSKDTNPGYWSDSVGGHVMRGETYEQAIAREAQEELGVTIPLELHSKYIFEMKHEMEMEALFTGTYNGPFYPDAVEVAQVQFFSKNELPRKLLSGEIKLTEFAYDALKKVGFIS